MLVSPVEILEDANRKGYALAGVNTPSFTSASAVIDAAEELGVPVMIGHAEAHEAFVSIDALGPMLRDLATRAKMPVILHLDHGRTVEYLFRAVRYGFTSIMYDCSDLPLDENADRVGEFTKLAHNLGIAVEAEVGRMPSTMLDEDGCVANGVKAEDIERYYSDPEEVARFVDETNVDMLAISFGNVHGKYPGEPKLDIERLERIHAGARTNLVMHGTTGVDEAQVVRAINGGIRKFNYYTGIATAPVLPLAALFAKTPVPYMHEVEKLGYDAMYRKALEIIRLFRNGK